MGSPGKKGKGRAVWDDGDTHLLAKGVIPDTFEMDMNRKAMILYTSGTTGKV